MVSFHNETVAKNLENLAAVTAERTVERIAREKSRPVINTTKENRVEWFFR